MSRWVPSLLSLVLCASSATTAAAQTDYFGDGDKELVYQEEGSRSKGEKITLLALAGATVLAGGAATYFALESKSLSEEVSATGRHSGEAWSQDLQDSYDDAVSNRTYAIVGYSIAGAFAAGALITLLVTDPGGSGGYQDYDDKGYIVPTQGGLMMGTGWSF